MPIFSRVFEPQVLAVLTRQMAVFPQNKSLLGPDGYGEYAYPRTPVSVTTPPARDLGFPSGFQRQRRITRRLSIKPRALPLSYNQEMINSLPPLCFPGKNLSLYLQYVAPFQNFHASLNSVCKGWLKMLSLKTDSLYTQVSFNTY